MKLTKDFQLSEFACHSGEAVPGEMLPTLQRLADALQVIRDAIGAPLTVVSGYRSAAWNAKVGGAGGSQHMRAAAADVACKTLTVAQLYSTILRLIRSGAIEDGGLGRYKSWVHYDVRGSADRWVG